VDAITAAVDARVTAAAPTAATAALATVLACRITPQGIRVGVAGK